jgi:hypothetical protein
MSHASRLEQVCFLLGIELGGEDGTPPSVSAFDAYVAASVEPFLAACRATEVKDLLKMADQTQEAFAFQRKFLYAATVCAKPTPEVLMPFLGPCGAIVEASGRFPRKTKVRDHHLSFEQAIQCVNWLIIDGGAPHVLGQRDAADFYLNKVLRYARDLTDDAAKAQHRAWVSTMKDMLTNLAEYVSTYHKTGIVWKFGGPSVAEFKEPEAGASAGQASEEDRLDAAVTGLEAYAARMAGGSGDGPPPALAAWKELLETELAAFVTAASAPELKLDKKIVEWATTAWTHCGRVVEASLEVKKPGDEKFAELLAPISGAIGASGDPARGATFDFEKSFNEVLQCLAWVCMDGAGDYIQSQVDASAMYTNKILRAARDAGDAKEPMRAYVKTLKELGMATKAYTQEWHKQGIVWRGQGTGLPESYTHFPQ